MGNNLKKFCRVSKFKEIPMTEEERKREYLSYAGQFFEVRGDQVISTVKSRTAFKVKTDGNRVQLFDRNRRKINDFLPSNNFISCHTRYYKAKGKLNFSVIMYKGDTQSTSFYSKITRKMLLKPMLKNTYVITGSLNNAKETSVENFFTEVKTAFLNGISFQIFHRRDNSELAFYYHLREEKMLKTQLNPEDNNLSFLGLKNYEGIMDNNQLYFLHFFNRKVILVYSFLTGFAIEKSLKGSKLENEADQLMYHTHAVYMFTPISLLKSQVICEQLFKFPTKVDSYSFSHEKIFFDLVNSQNIEMLVFVVLNKKIVIFDFDDEGFKNVFEYGVENNNNNRYFRCELRRNDNILLLIDVSIDKSIEPYPVKKFELFIEAGKQEYDTIDLFD